MSDVEDTADLITRLNAKAIVEAYRAGKEAGQADRDRLRELLAAVKASQFEGIYCDDVNGVNWFDARDEELQEAGDE